jgi:hypothetical protein
MLEKICELLYQKESNLKSEEDIISLKVEFDKFHNFTFFLPHNNISNVIQERKKTATSPEELEASNLHTRRQTLPRNK